MGAKGIQVYSVLEVDHKIEEDASIIHSALAVDKEKLLRSKLVASGQFLSLF
ncbi:hypothetical protein ACET3Z_010802 [Daucus carota]